MTNYIKRLLYVDSNESERINPLVYPFIIATFFYGLGFTFLGFWSGVNSSSLFAALAAFHPWLPVIWGVMALLAGICAVTLMLIRKGQFGEYASMLGTLVWVFAGITYVLNGFWLVLFTVVVPNCYFWIWYYMRVKLYERRKAAGLIDVQ